MNNDKVEVIVETVLLRSNSFLMVLDGKGAKYLIDRRQVDCDDRAWQRIKKGCRLDFPAKELSIFCVEEPASGKQKSFSNEPYQWKCFSCNKQGGTSCEFGDDIDIVVKKAEAAHDKVSQSCPREKLHLYICTDGSLREIDQFLNFGMIKV
jgi:hypothetical protein